MLKNISIWFPSYVTQCIKRLFAPRAKGPVQVMFCVADHFEPRWGKVGLEKELERTERWITGITPVLERHADAEGKHPAWTLFYPIDEFTPPVFEKIGAFCKNGFGEIEVHLHHDNDTETGLREKIAQAKELYAAHGHLGRDRRTNDIRYGFIHGNWALDNSRRDGRWCGVNNELAVLADTGCYADFTLPSWPSETQTRKINSIYYAKDTPAPKSHDAGLDVTVGSRPSGDLLLIQGPLALNWKRRKVENAEITLENPPTDDRVDLWIDQRIGVRGRPDWVFVKVHTHGAQDKNLSDAFFAHINTMFTYLETAYNDGERYRLHYVTAREMYNIVKAAEAGEHGDPGEYRDYLVQGIGFRDVHRTSDIGHLKTKGRSP